MQKEFHYRNILLTSKYSELNSRSEADTSVKLGERTFKLPVVPSNMSSIIDVKLAKWLAVNGYFYIMHRFGVDQLAFCKEMKEYSLNTSISVGVNKDSYETLITLKKEGLSPDYITVDIAHGEAIKMRNMLQFIKFAHPNSFVIAGNVCTREGVSALEAWGADCVKIGIGPGSVCTTKLQTGFSRPQFSAVLECSEAASKPVIADGGIEHNGDIAKALVAGATLVMAGQIFAGFNESPGETQVDKALQWLLADKGEIERILSTLDETHVIDRASFQSRLKKVNAEIDGLSGQTGMKEYYGSASEHNKGENRHVEGKHTLIPCRGPIANKFKEITESLRSSISYAGGKDLSAFLNVKWTISE